jgi:hypothetical protein
MSSGASAAGPEADPEAGVVVGRASSSGASVRVTAADATLSAALREFIRARASTSPRPSPAQTHPASSSPASAARDVSARVSDLERLLEINRELNRLDAAAASDDDDATRGSHGDRLGGRAAPRADGSDEGRASSSAAASFGFDHRGASRWFEHTAPVLVILGLAFAVSHAVGILAYAWSTLALMRANEATKRLARDFRKEDAAGDEESIAIAGDEESIGGQMSGVSGATAGTTAAAGASSRGGGERGDESASSAAAAASPTNRSRFRRSIRATRDAAAVILLCVVSLVVLRRVFPEDEFWARVAFPFDLGAGALRRLFSSAFFFIRGVKTTDGGARNNPGHGYYSFGWENPKLGGGGANDAGSFSSGAFFAALWTSAMADVVAKFVAVAAKCASVLVGDWRAERDAKTYSSSSRRHSTSTNTARDAAATRRAARRARRVLGARLSLLEHATLLWRAAIPAPIWFAYFRAGAGLGRAASAACAGAYLAHKGRVLFAAARAVGEAHAALGAACASDRVGERVRLAPGEAEVWVGGGGGGVSGGGGSARANDEGSFANDGASAGKHTNTHARALGDECAICQEPYRDPTRLRCAHVFCEGCVAEWFDRDERTCPLCRAVVVDGVGSRAGDAHRDGGTVMFAHAF